MVIDMQRETRGVSSRLRFGHDVMLFASRIKWAEPELRGLGALVKEGDRVIDVGAEVPTPVWVKSLAASVDDPDGEILP